MWPQNVVWGVFLWATLVEKSFMMNLAVNETAVTHMSPQTRNVESEISYYGYHLDLFTDKNNRSRLTIGAPKMIDPESMALHKRNTTSDHEPKGGIMSCEFDSTIDNGIAHNCTLTDSSKLLPGDNFGMFGASKSGGNSMACSLTRKQDCGNASSTPGICFESSDFGSIWQKDDRTISLGCPGTNVEVLFVLDGSGSVGNESFDIVKQWVKNITQKLDIDTGKVTVGVVQYSHYFDTQDINEQRYIKTHIKIGQYKTYEKLAVEIDRIKLDGYTTYTGRALQKVVYDFQNTFHYNESTTKQIMILLTDGKATDAENVTKNAQNLRDLGVLPYAVGVGNEVNITELNLIATGDPRGNNTRVLMTGTFSGLDVVAKELESTITAVALEGASSGQNTAGSTMEFGAMGISIAYSILPNVRKNQTVSEHSDKVRFIDWLPIMRNDSTSQFFTLQPHYSD
uniref:integrin alpha-D-like n=1 Tax=Styela clava TaxID=7725 RepID=UPI00193A9C42|nr:integrin alpha-D-like [Styela clava]